MKQQKNAGVTLLLNFVFPGAGHVYASDGVSWQLLAANIGCAVLGVFLIVPLLACPVIWIYSMVQSADVTQRYNNVYFGDDLGGGDPDVALWRRDEAARETTEREARRAREAAAEAERKAKQLAATAERVAKEATAEAERKAKDETERARAEALVARRVCGEDMAKSFQRVHGLRLGSVLTDEEAAEERKAILKTASEGWTDESKLDFLGPFTDLVQDGGVSQEELEAVKARYGGIFQSA